MDNYSSAIKENDIKKDVNFIMHRNSHYGESAWKLLGFSEIKDNCKRDFSDMNGCYISIGCKSGKLAEEDIDFIRKSNTPFNEFENIFSNKIDANKPRFRYSLYRFLFEYKKNDYLIIPDKSYFHVFQIEDEKLLTCKDIEKQLFDCGVSAENVAKDNSDFKFFKKLKPIRINISKKEYAKSYLNSALKFRGTVLYLSDNAKQDVITALIATEPISIYSGLLESSIDAINKSLLSLSPDKFEQLIAWYFRKIGADSAKVLPKNPYQKREFEDADVEAVFENLKLKVVVQAKFYNGKADLNWACEQIKRYDNLQNDEFDYTCVRWVITTASIAEYNKDYLDDNIRIIDGAEFAQMLLDAGIKDIDSAF